MLSNKVIISLLFAIVAHGAPIPQADPTSAESLDFASAEAPQSTTTFSAIDAVATSTPVEPTSVAASINSAPTSIDSALPSLTTWASDPKMADLSSFNITKFAFGLDNIQILSGGPAPNTIPSALDASDDLSTTTNPTAPLWSTDENTMQVKFPAGSVNPSNTPRGGADFYAAPLDLSKASNVTLEYSVFFPHDFDFVKGGKLPGLYGGHEGCSGGDDASDCWSTRMMWRKDGAGELYLVSD